MRCIIFFDFHSFHDDQSGISDDEVMCVRKTMLKSAVIYARPLSIDHRSLVKRSTTSPFVASVLPSAPSSLVFRPNCNLCDLGISITTLTFESPTRR
jgi:hypothetical protein